MKNYVLLLALTLMACRILAQEGYPTPPLSKQNLFYIQRSGNTNTIVYDANVIGNNKISTAKPVDIYWIRYTNGGAKEGLTFIQRNLAYGLSLKHLGENKYEFNFVSYSKMKFLMYIDAGGKPCAKLQVNGKQMVIRRIFIAIEESSRWTLAPKVQYVEFFGTDPWNGRSMYEKFYP
jgi:hypothetical protein